MSVNDVTKSNPLTHLHLVLQMHGISENCFASSNMSQDSKNAKTCVKGSPQDEHFLFEKSQFFNLFLLTLKKF